MSKISFLIKCTLQSDIEIEEIRSFIDNNKLYSTDLYGEIELIKNGIKLDIKLCLDSIILVTKLLDIVGFVQSLKNNIIENDYDFEFINLENDPKLMGDVLLSTLTYHAFNINAMSLKINKLEEQILLHKSSSDVNFSALHKAGAYETNTILESLHRTFENNDLVVPDISYNITEH